MSSAPSFEAAILSKQIKEVCQQFDDLLSTAKSDEITQLRQTFRSEFKEYQQNKALTVAFVGQYSAGKSTIISALTGRRDIHIDTDIATDKTTSYDWNGIQIIDTPGLFTDRKDHDDITYQAIAKADLLVFCLTHMLFDTLTVENFKKLAYTEGYRWKIMLVINKMSAAAGEEDQKIASYRHSLADALKPYSLDEFPICFIDAQDYCEGVDEDDEFLEEVSRFETFIAELNQFVKQRSSLTKFDVPIRITLKNLDESQILFARNSDEDTAFLLILSHLSRRIERERERLRTNIKRIALDLSIAINEEGRNLAAAVGDPEFESLNSKSELNVREYYESASEELYKVLEAANLSIQNEVLDELKSGLTTAFIRQLNLNDELGNHQSPKEKGNAKQAQSQFNFFKEIGEKIGVSLAKSATGRFATGTGKIFLRSMDATGSALHKGILEIGKLIGFKFRPWQAVNMAKGIGNAAKFLGPALGILAIAAEFYGMAEEQKREQEMADIRRDITSTFKALTIDLEQQINEIRTEFEQQVYGTLERNIDAAKQKTFSAMNTSSTELARVEQIRTNLRTILDDIQKSVSSPLLDQQN
ncbi:GTPase [Leptolyngbya sp. CCY15150]|uniref:GTPase n=1 Tax=Leptolyngbya sp. CCY15150 TaxID=2767772 RepID=UPI00194EF789|nr:GTPase [Leptolyngbya sp. CCY15150]